MPGKLMCAPLYLVIEVNAGTCMCRMRFFFWRLQFSRMFCCLFQPLCWYPVLVSAWTWVPPVKYPEFRVNIFELSVLIMNWVTRTALPTPFATHFAWVLEPVLSLCSKAALGTGNFSTRVRVKRDSKSPIPNRRFRINPVLEIQVLEDHYRLLAKPDIGFSCVFFLCSVFLVVNLLFLVYNDVLTFLQTKKGIFKCMPFELQAANVC